MALNLIIGRFEDDPENPDLCKRLVNLDISDEMVALYGGERGFIAAVMLGLSTGATAVKLEDIAESFGVPETPKGPPAGALTPDELDEILHREDIATYVKMLAPPLQSAIDSGVTPTAAAESLLTFIPRDALTGLGAFQSEKVERVIGLLAKEMDAVNSPGRYAWIVDFFGSLVEIGRSKGATH